jgi:hypothetical protein
MPHSASSSLSPVEATACGTRGGLRVAAFWAVGILWAILVLARCLGAGPEDSVTACRHAIYRDPVTGREQGTGSARVAPDGTITCRGMAYKADPR